MRRAYDRVEWSFLGQVMLALSFHYSWVVLINWEAVLCVYTLLIRMITLLVINVFRLCMMILGYDLEN